MLNLIMLKTAIYSFLALLWGSPILLQVTDVMPLVEQANPWGVGIWGLFGIAGWFVWWIQRKETIKSDTLNETLHNQMITLQQKHTEQVTTLQQDHAAKQSSQLEKQLEVMNALKLVISEGFNSIRGANHNKG